MHARPGRPRVRAGRAPDRASRSRAGARPKVDCFYVYPTVSDQRTSTRTCSIDPEERSIALYQAARYSQVCRVYAPMYRQITLPAICSARRVTRGDADAAPTADVATRGATTCSKYNHGRGVVLIGHSQGAFVLRQLIDRRSTANPPVRRRLVSAILLGGNVDGRGGQGRRRRLPARAGLPVRARRSAASSRSRRSTRPVPGGQRSSAHAPAGQQVLCTNPAALARRLGAARPRSSPARRSRPGTTIAAAI